MRWFSLAVAVLALGACAHDDSGVGQPDLSVTGAQLLVVEDGTSALLTMTIQSSDGDELVRAATADHESAELMLFRQLEPVGDSPEPSPVGPLDSVTITAGEPTVFGVDGYGAVLEGPGLPAKDATSARFTLEFAKHDPVEVTATVTS